MEKSLPSKWSCSRGIEDAILLIMNTEPNQKRPLLLVGDWKPYETEDQAAPVLEQLRGSIQGAPFTFYVALPFTWVQEKGGASSENLLVGSRSLMRLSSEVFPPSLALSVLKESN